MFEDRFKNRIKLTQEVLNKISKIDEFKGLWRGSARLSPQILGRLKAWVIVTSTGASTRIEGAKMTDEEIDRFLRGLSAKPPKNRDEQEVAGYADLIARVFDNYKMLKLSENWILQFHSILLNFSEKDQLHKGKYKVVNNTVIMINKDGEQVVLFNPTAPYLVQPEMQTAIEWTNEQINKELIHPIIAIANFIFEFLAIHPFRDGNGRLSRALTNLLLLKTGYSYIPYASLDEVIEETRTNYYLALRAAQKNRKTKNEDITPFLIYFLDTLIEHTERVKKIMDSDQPEKLLSEKQLQVYQLFDKENNLSVSDIDKILNGGIKHATIKQALSRLVNAKLLERIGLGRSTRYRVLNK